jgi:dipeptide/tripeptide permease
MVFLYFPIYNLNDGGIGSVATSQGGAMTSNGVPNDLLNNFNPLVIIVFIPFLSHVLYPALRHRNINFGRVSRITTGFCFAIASGVVGSLVQWRIYKTSPCGFQATNCSTADGTVSPISLWWQLPIYGLGGISECFANVTAYELAYARARKSFIFYMSSTVRTQLTSPNSGRYESPGDGFIPVYHGTIVCAG